MNEHPITLAHSGLRLIWGIFACLIIFLALLSVPHSAQIGFAVASLVLMGALLLGMRLVPERTTGPAALRDGLRIAILTVGGFVTLRYLSWRIGHTVNFHGIVGYLGALLLLAAEIYGLVLYFIGGLISARPRHREPVPLDEATLPTMDVMIPTYNEDPELVEVTVLAATQLDYPAERLQVWVLDDGGTESKLHHADHTVAAAALERQAALQALCDRTGAHYMSRKDNTHAKAGNVNAALARTDGELVLMLDADHVPTRDFLHNTVGFFQRDPELFLVQTPHRFINPDPIERNLEVWGRMPGESEMFYRIVQPGLDAWNASFFCGSAAVLRRRCLDDLGGLSGETITEDSETAIELHARGYRSVYLDKPMVFGLQPETFESFVTQRCRWAQGMVQIFLLKNPLLKTGLNWAQRLGYLSSTLFWFFSFARLVFLFAPVAFLLFGLKIYDANLHQFTAYALPHLVGTLVTAHVLFGKARWTLVSELYEVVQSWFSSKAVWAVLRSPRSPVFKVTTKGERLERQHVSPLAGPLYVMLSIICLALAAGIWKYFAYPDQREVVYITMGWAALNVMLLLAALGAVLEHRQLRRFPRVTLAEPREANLLLAGQLTSGRIADLSMGGCHLYIDQPDFEARFGRATLQVVSEGETHDLAARVVAVGPERDWVRLEFLDRDIEAKRLIVGLGFGDSRNTAWGVDRSEEEPGILGGMAYFARLGLRHGGANLKFIAGHAWHKLRGWARGVSRSCPSGVENQQ